MRRQRTGTARPTLFISGWFIFLILLLALHLAMNTTAQVTLLKKPAQELLEAITKKGGREAADDLLALGGEQGVKQLLDQARKEGGEKLVQRIVKITEAHGAGALKGIALAPARMVRALDEMPPNFKTQAVAAISREPETMARLISEHGSGALLLAAKHPGIGPQIAGKLGQEGIDTAMRLSTPDAVRLTRLADPIAGLPPAQKSGVLEMIQKSPGKVLDLLESHPKILFTSAGVISLLAVKDQILGTSEIFVHDDGRVEVIRKPGLIERAGAVDRLFGPIYWFLGGFLLLWGGFRIWGILRTKKT